MGQPDPPPSVGGVDRRIQLGISAVVIVGSWVTAAPLGLTGTAGLAVVLLAVNSLFQLARHLPTDSVPDRLVLPLLCCWGVAAAALLAIRFNGVSPAFAYMAAGHVGFRLRPRAALVLAAGLGVLSAAGLAVANAHGLDGWPAVVGFTVALPVFLGMSNRSREQAVTSMIEAARSAQRATAAEAREQALAERARISRDIHDVLAHSLSGVSMQLELGEMLLDGGDVARAREAVERAHSLVREGMTEARRAVSALRTEVLPLEQTLRALFAGSAELVVAGTAVELPTQAGQTLIRAAQESLTNARRHARGSEVEARLEFRPDSVRLTVSNGPPAAGPAGAPAAAPAGSGMGLVGMRERAALLGGQVTAEPLVGGPLAGGWRVDICVPVTPVGAGQR